MTGRVHLLGAAAIVVAVAGCTDKLPGTYAGDLTLSRSASVTLTRSGGAAKVRRFSGAKRSDGATVTVRARGEGYRVELPGCAFDAERDPTRQSGFSSGPKQSCVVNLDGTRVAFSLSGGGRLAAAGSLSLAIDGAATTPGASGGVSWSFDGTKR